MTCINALTASATITDALSTIKCGSATLTEAEKWDTVTEDRRNRKETWDRKTRVAAYAITARSFRRTIRRLDADSSLEDIFGDSTPPNVRLTGLMAGELEVHDGQEEAAEQIEDEVVRYIRELLPDLKQDYDETDLTAMRNLEEAFWYAAKRMIAQNRYALDAIRAIIESGLKDAQANQAVDMAMNASWFGIKDLEYATDKCCT